MEAYAYIVSRYSPRGRIKKIVFWDLSGYWATTEGVRKFWRKYVGMDEESCVSISKEHRDASLSFFLRVVYRGRVRGNRIFRKKLHKADKNVSKVKRIRGK